MNMKKAVIIFIAVMSCVSLSGCKNYIIGNNEINDITFPGVVAIDVFPENKDLVEFTVASDKSPVGAAGGAGGGDSQEAKKSEVLYSEGRTVFEAHRASTADAVKDIHWGHSGYIIIGEEAARENILKYLDFFIRDSETRLTTDLLVSKNCYGAEIIQKFETSESVRGKFKQLFNNTGSLSLIKEVKLSDFMEKMNDKYSAAYIPCVHIENKQNISNMQGKHLKQDEKQEQDKGQGDKQGSQSEEKGDSTLATNGYAVFKGTKLMHFISGDMARALNFVTNDIRSAAIIVKNDKGEYVSLEVIDSSAKIKTKVENDIPSISVKVRLHSNVDEINGQTNVFNEKGLTNLNAQQSEIVKNNIESLISFAKENNVDVFGFGDKIYHQHPVKWERIKGKWDTIFPNVEVSVEVESRISRVYGIKQPVRSDSVK